MDIRNFFEKGISSVKRKKNRESSSGSDNTHLPQSSAPEAPSTSTKEIDSNDGCHINDVGRYVGRAHQLSAEIKKSILLRPWVPEAKYDFRNDAQSLQRKFNYAWLDQYAPWLVYSKRLKGALCKYCVLFPPAPGSVRGVLGSFMVRPFLKFKNVHEYCKKHATTSLHLTATAAAKAFTENVPIDVQLQNSHEKLKEDNRNIISSIISCVVFCGTHDMPLRGKEQDGGVLLDLINMRIESGDTVLKSHLEKCRRNAIYTSPQIQNELIKIGGEVIKGLIILDVKKADAFSVLADETADIAGKEQLSIGLRFYDKTMGILREEFVGFIELTSQDASTIAAEIDKFLINNELTPEYCVGFGFDGCSTMAGKEGGVQAILRKKYTRAQYFHCSSHKLNLVVNDVNLVPEKRNTISTIKDVINFFRESTTRRNYAPNISRLCETRWSEKYKAIRKFSQNFTDIAKALDKLSVEGNSCTRKSAYQGPYSELRCESQCDSKTCKYEHFLFCVTMFAKYFFYSHLKCEKVASRYSVLRKQMSDTYENRKIYSTAKQHSQSTKMETNNKTTKSHQFEIMVEFMMKHSQLAKGHLKTLNARQSANALWQTLAEELNASGPPIRETAGWKKVWADFKVHTKQKLRRNKTDIGGTGGGPSKFNPLTPLEEKVVELLNMEDSVNGLSGALSFGTTTDSCEQNNIITEKEQLEEVPSEDLLAEAIADSAMGITGRSQSCEQNPRKRSRSVSFCDRDGLLKKQVENQMSYQKESLSLFQQINENLKSIGRYQRKEFELREKELNLTRQRFQFDKENAAEASKLTKQKLELKKRMLDVEEEKLKLM